MKSLETLLKEGTRTLEEAGIKEAGLDAWLLLEYVIKKSRAYYYAHKEEKADKEAEECYLGLCRKRAMHIPLQHLTHQAFFMGYELYVDENVLIPRQDTEVLVEEGLKILEGIQAPRVLDMCTGSGCILLSILAQRPDAAGTGADVSQGAVAIAQRNAEELKVGKRALIVRSNLFTEIPKEEYDMVISNPPYIPTGEIAGLMEEVRRHDPFIALDGKEDGLFFYREITRQAKTYLKKGGWLLYEIGCTQGDAVSAVMGQQGFLNIQVKQDLSGLDRVVLGQKQ